MMLYFSDNHIQGHGIFAALRELDKPGIDTVWARCPEGDGVALAVRNRLEKAAGFERVDGEVME